MEPRRAAAILAIFTLLGSVWLMLMLYPPESRFITRTWSIFAKDYPSETVNIDITLTSADVVIQQLDTAELIVNLTANFRSYQAEPLFNVALSGSTLYVTIKTEEMAFGVPESITDSYILSLGKYSRDTSLRLRGGAISGLVKLTELSLKEVSLDISTGSLELDLMDYMNPISCLANLTVGGASLRADGLSNLNFSYMSVKVGAGTARLNFTGEHRLNMTRALVEASIATIDVILPSKIGCTLSSKVLGVLNLDSTWKITREVGGRTEYQTPRFDEATHKIFLTVDAGVATINIQRQQE